MKHRLKELRLENGKTQKEMGEITSVGRSTWAGYEAGTIAPSLAVLEILAEHFDVSVDYLTGRSEYRSDVERWDAQADVEQLRRSLRLHETHTDVGASTDLYLKRLLEPDADLTWHGRPLSQEQRGILLDLIRVTKRVLSQQ